MRCHLWIAIAVICVCTSAFAGGPKTCVAADEASKTPDKDVCITAHIYEIVQLADGTRFLDVCPPDVPDAGCHFTIMSLPEDRREVGDPDALSQHEREGSRHRAVDAWALRNAP